MVSGRKPQLLRGEDVGYRIRNREQELISSDTNLICKGLLWEGRRISLAP
jgi:hypothetical protein